MTRGSNNKKYSKKINRGRSPYTLLLIIGGVLLLGAAAFLFKNGEQVDPNYVPEVTGRPSLKVDKEQIDFGDVPLNKTVTATFVLTNVGDQTLKFTKDPYIEVKEGC